MMTTFIVLGCVIAYFAIGFYPFLWSLRKLSKYDHEVRNVLEVDNAGSAGVLILSWIIWVITVPILLSCVYSNWKAEQQKVSTFTLIVRRLFSQEKIKEEKEEYL